MLLARVLDRLQHAFNAAFAESAGHEQSVVLFQLRFITLIGFVRGFQTLGFNPIQFQLQVVRQRAVHQRLFQRLIGILILHVLADNADSDHILRVVDAVHQVVPLRKITILGLEFQTAQHQRIHLFMRETHRHLVNGCDVLRRDHRLFFNVTEQRDLRLDLFRKKAIGAAQQNVRLNSGAEQLFDGVLGRLGLQFLRRGDKRHQRHVDEQSVIAPQFLPHLADRLDERQRLDVAHRAADFNQRHVHVLRDFLRRRLDLVGDVRNHLHRLAQVIAPPLFGDDLLVEAPGGPIVIARKFGVSKAFVVTEIEIGFRAVIGDEHFAMLKRRHRPRIHVQVRIELHQVDFEAAAFQQTANRSRRQSLAQ